VRYFVTGVTGFVGGRVARQLVEAGHEVVTLARNPGRAQELAGLGAAVHQGDITDKESMRSPMAGVDGLFHIAAWYRVGARDTSPAAAINVDGTRTVLELMRELEIPKGVYTSTLAVFSDTGGRMVDESYRYDGPHLSEYDRTKWVAHYQIAEPMMRSRLPLVIVQPGLVYGPGDTSLLHDTWVQYLRRRLLAIPARAEFCWGYVDDIARGHILAMERGRPGETYIIAGPRYSTVEAFQMAQQITGIPAPRLHLGPGVMKLAAALMEPAGRIVPLPAIYTAEGLRSTAGTYLGSNEKAKRELGYTVRSLQEGLPETLAYEMRALGLSASPILDKHAEPP
jgi:nucleoside-diphosphate-sugar epimerase